MTVPAHLSLITLGVADLGRATAFYGRLGWKPLPSSEETITFIQLGTVVLGLFGWEALAQDATVAAVGHGFRGVTLAINLSSPTQVDTAVASWVAAGGALVKQPHEVFWGGYSGYVADLDGHLWEIAHNPFSPEWAAPPT